MPLSTRLRGKIRISGGGRLGLGNGITLTGNVVPIELISHEGACITIGDHTFINYGSSPETFLLIVWRRAIRLASFVASGLATLVHRRSFLASKTSENTTASSVLAHSRAGVTAIAG